MPAELVQQVPYIRRALEAYRIPILELAGYEADDVIGTLARSRCAQWYLVYVVSSDKDMLQLVNDRVLVLNPPKDNLICDAKKVEEILGCAAGARHRCHGAAWRLHGQHPGRCRGSATRVRSNSFSRFGTVEQALDRAAEVEKKSYRESLQNNRDNVLFSKRMATIDCDVPVDLDMNAMRAGEPDLEALRALFTELEFTSLLKELLPVVEVTESTLHRGEIGR